MTSTVKIVIVDDHPLFRAGVARSLQENPRFKVVAEGGSCSDAVQIAAEHRPDIVLLDISMPGGGIEAASAIADKWPRITIVMLTASETSDDVMAALKAGAKGYVLKGIGSAALIDIVDAISSGQSYVPPTLAARLISELGAPSARSGPADELERLTPREEEILRFVSTGLSNKEVALQLDLQEKTVKHHMTRILSKLRARNRTEAALKLRESSARRS